MNLVGNSRVRTTLPPNSTPLRRGPFRTSKSRLRPSKQMAAVRCASGHLVGGGHFGLGGLARQRVVGAFIKLPDAVAIETLLFYLEVSA
jgi:hypothetical protein